MTGLSTTWRLDLWNTGLVLELGLEQEGERKGSVALPRWLFRTDCRALSGLMEGRAGVWLAGAQPLVREDTGSKGSGFSSAASPPLSGDRAQPFWILKVVQFWRKTRPQAD